MADKERKHEKAIRKIEVAVRKALDKGVTRNVVEDVVGQAIVAMGKGAPKKASAKKTSVRAPTAKNTRVKRVVAKKTPAKVAVAKKASVKRVVAKKTPAKVAAAKKNPANRVVAEEAPVVMSVAEEVPEATAVSQAER